MLDAFTGDTVDVRLDPECGPYIMIEPAEIARVEELLRQHGIPFALEDGPNAPNGTPEAAVIDFGKGADLENIQRVLDSAP
ncbi:MAG: hypothetical protein ABSH20_00025 [Tepidisphaeraceae bacterium]|jgi:hypothetical protein